MTLILQLDLDMIKLHAKSKVAISRGSIGKEMTENITYPHTWVVTMLDTIKLIGSIFLDNC